MRDVQMPLIDFIRSVVTTPAFVGGVRRTDPETSKQAAAKVGKGVEQAVAVEFQRARAAGVEGLTDDEVASRLHWMHPPTVKSARSRLSKRGVLCDSGGCRQSLRGLPMTVWRLADG